MNNKTESYWLQIINYCKENDIQHELLSSSPVDGIDKLKHVTHNFLWGVDAPTKITNSLDISFMPEGELKNRTNEWALVIETCENDKQQEIYYKDSKCFNQYLGGTYDSTKVSDRLNHKKDGNWILYLIDEKEELDNFQYFLCKLESMRWLNTEGKNKLILSNVPNEYHLNYETMRKLDENLEKCGFQKNNEFRQHILKGIKSYKFFKID